MHFQTYFLNSSCVSIWRLNDRLSPEMRACLYPHTKHSSGFACTSAGSAASGPFFARRAADVVFRGARTHPDPDAAPERSLRSFAVPRNLTREEELEGSGAGVRGRETGVGGIVICIWGCIENWTCGSA